MARLMAALPNMILVDLPARTPLILDTNLINMSIKLGWSLFCT
uniref:Uncharacterized protein n=1 Tax=Kalanchoe fedtschenkoi TaxID=63787 RepID=A0A7N0TL09_KALFE